MKILPVLCLSAFSLCSGMLHSAGDEVRPSPTGELVDVGGYRVHLYCSGSGSPTVVVVGGGFSFDWGLVQPPVARTTRICTYDPSGTAWSDPTPSGTTATEREGGPQTLPTCRARVSELHELLRRASVKGPYVIVGFSIGGLYGRLYAAEYSEEVAGMVLVDHAFIDPGPSEAQREPEPPAEQKGSPRRQEEPASVRDVDTPPALLSAAPITLGLEDDQNFHRLPRSNQALHSWALSLDPIRPSAQTVKECAEAIDRTSSQIAPLGMRPLVLVSTGNTSPGYQGLQAMLLALSRNHKQIVAENSTHMVLVDAPDTIVRAIGDVVTAVRTRALLTK